MSTADEAETQSAHTSEAPASRSSSRHRPRSVKSWRTRSRSRPPSPDTHLHRIYSSGFPDHHGTYLDSAAWDMGAEAAAFTDLADREVSTSSHEQTESEEATEKAEGLEEVESHQSEHDGESPGDDRSGDNAKLEKGPPLNRQRTGTSTRSKGADRDPHLVTWQGTNDPENPKNWPQKKKWAAVIVVSSFTFISPLASTLVAPALPQIARDLNIHGTTLENMVLSIFILAYAIGPMILGPLSEVFGRVPVLQLANVFFIIFNLVCGFAQTIPEILVFRFLAGLGGSAPLGVGVRIPTRASTIDGHPLTAIT